MYKIYCDNQLFYKSGIDDEDFYIVSGTLDLEKGKVSTLKLGLPSSNIAYPFLNQMSSIVTVYDGDDELFRGRVLYDDKDFFNNKVITCEGDIAFLLDSIKRPYEHQGSPNDFFKDLINNHNSQVDTKKQFTVGNITVTDNNDYIARSSVDYDNTYNVIQNKLISALGGYLKSRSVDNTRYLDYVAELGETSDQVIKFGENLLDIKQYLTAENIFTCLIPLGKKDEETGERVTIKSVNGVDYLENETAIELFGRIFAIQTWDDVTEPSNLKTKGQAYLDENSKMSLTLTLKAVDLHLLDVSTSRIKVGDKVRVISLPHKLDEYFECSKIHIDLLNPQNNEYTFGATYRTFTDPSFDIDKLVVEYVDGAITKVTDETTSRIEQEVANKVDAITQEDIMNIITNNGEVEGVYLVNGQIWIKGTYIESDSISTEKLKAESITSEKIKAGSVKTNHLQANSITSNHLQSDSVTSDKINVDKLSAISANLGSITGGSLNINNKFIVDSSGNATVDGKVTAKSGNVGGFSLDETTMSATVTKTFNYTQSDLDSIKSIIMNGTTQTDALLAKYDINGDGRISSMDYTLIKNILEAGNKITTSFKLHPNYSASNHNAPIFEVKNNAYGRTWIDQLGYLNSKKGTFDSLFIGDANVEDKFSPMGCTKDGGGATLLWSGSDYAPMFYVGEIEQYKYFLVQLGSASSNHATWVLCPYCPTYISSYFRGIGGYETDGTDTGGRIYFVDGSISEGTVTIRSCWMRNSPTYTTVASATQMYVKKVVGIR